MSTVQEIEQAIRGLEPKDLAALREWFAAFDAEAWDRQLEQDAATGRLDKLADDALPEKRTEVDPATGIPPVETWLDRLVFDRAAHPSERVVKGTRLEAEALVAELAAGRSEEELRKRYAELTAEDVAALRNYALAPATFRRLCGAWAEDAEELNQFLEETRRARKLPRRGLEA